MFRILIDTCVWLELAKDPRQVPVIGVVEEMVRRKLVQLIVPRVVLDEFQRNRGRIEKESAKSLTSHIRLVKDAVGKIGGDKRRTRTILSHLDDVGLKAPIVGGAAVQALDQIEKLLTSSLIVETSEAVRLRAGQRAIEKRAPFHHDKNAMADAVIIETYADCLRASTPGLRFAFVTHNTNDFSLENRNQKVPHPDFAALFSRIKSLYFINLPEALRRVEPSLVTDLMVELSWTQEPRGLTEILEAEDLLFHQVWYNRHQNARYRIERGETKIVEKETFPIRNHTNRPIQRDVWEMAQKAAKRVERKYGLENLGPWDDFEWGMVNGKLSALRWVLGDEWDFLDT